MDAVRALAAAEAADAPPPRPSSASLVVASAPTDTPAKTHLVESLKRSIQHLTLRLAGVAREEGATPQPVPQKLSDDVREVRELVAAVEQCVFHGVRVEEFQVG